jgi:hypothetical protein
MQDKSYNGWTNYETWAVGMFLDGNYTGEHTYREVLALAEDHDSDARESERDPDDAVYTLANALQEWFNEQLPELDGIASDLLGAAVSEINWTELAKSKLTEIGEYY